MKNRFAEYYELPEERIKEIWDNSLIVFDTNVLLNLYRYNEDARTEFINVIKFYKERLWIPYQVGLEFHRRREEIMRKNAKAYNVLAEKLSKELMGVVSSLEGEYARHPYINMKDIKSRVKKCADSIKRTLDKQEKVHPDFSKGDETLNTITELFDGKVGADFSEKELEMLYKDGEKRYANKVPPGYCDEKNKKDNGKRSLYGDLIVWKQTLEYCKEQKRNAIFITDDYKTDWWDKVEGKHSPRKELIKEFADYTEQGVIIYDSSRFLDYAKRNKELIISAKTIKEVEKVKNDNIQWYVENFMPNLRLDDYVKNSLMAQYEEDKTNSEIFNSYADWKTFLKLKSFDFDKFKDTKDWWEYQWDDTPSLLNKLEKIKEGRDIIYQKYLNKEGQ